MTTLTIDNIREFINKPINIYCKQYHANRDVCGQAVITAFKNGERNPIKVGYSSGEGRFLEYAIVNENGVICIGDLDRPVEVEQAATKMQTIIKMQKYIDKNIKSIAVEKRGNKFYGTLTGKEGRTFEFSKDAFDIERYFSNTRTSHKHANLKELMLLKYFQRLFVGVYASRRQLVDLGILETI